ncbi:FUSC family protein [Mesobacillus zeae]|uniref:Aromatic acid exporter family protein n=1 Tax=Mesobacillus zeae TaxID=1917180 RepID=A0A398AV21_9BACI|nr:aromatic acid exporter family protein [Mesobacillus zeae]RID81537.1 aromatic acid exporter family protein [Mesobacillus zeae]
MVTLGPRVLKTGLAVTLALYISIWLGLEPPLFAGIAATFTIQPSIYRSWKQVLEQVQANTVGALIAIGSIYVFGNSPIVIGLVMVLVILVCLKIRMADAISLTLVTVLVMMSAPDLEGVEAAAHKFLIVLVGMGSAFLVNIVISPPNYKKNFADQANSTFNTLSLLLRTAISNELTERSFQNDWKELKKGIEKLESLYEILDEEREKISKLKRLDVREIIVFKQMLDCLRRGTHLLAIVEEHFFQSQPDGIERQLFDRHLEYLIMYHEMILLKIEGKAKQTDSEGSNKALEDTNRLLERVLEGSHHQEQEKHRLIVVGSSIYDYAFQLHRLDELAGHYLKKKKHVAKN